MSRSDLTVTEGSIEMLKEVQKGKGQNVPLRGDDLVLVVLSEV